MADAFTDFISSNNLIQSPLNLVFNIALPVIVLTIAFAFLFERIKIFKNSGAARYLVGAVMSIALVFIYRIGFFGFWLGLAGVLMFKLKDWPSRILSFVIFGVIIMQIGFTTDPQVLLSKAIFIGFSFTALLIAMTDTNIIYKIIMVVIIYAAYFYLLPFLAAFRV